MADGNIMYIGYVDVPTKTVLASYPRTLKRGTATFVEEALANVCEDAMETATNKSIKKLEFNYETVYYKADDEIKGVVVAMIYEENYPERFVYTLIQEIWREINMLPPRVNDAHGIPISMQKKLGSPMIRIFKRYDNVVEVDHAVRAKMQIDEASYAVGDSMKKIIGTCANLEELKSKSLKLKNQTVVLKQDATKLKSHYSSRVVLVVLYVIVVVVIILLYITLPLVLNKKEKDLRGD